MAGAISLKVKMNYQYRELNSNLRLLPAYNNRLCLGGGWEDDLAKVTMNSSINILSKSKVSLHAHPQASGKPSYK